MIFNRTPPPRFFGPDLKIYHLAHHVRWHEKKGLKKPECGWCLEDKTLPETWGLE